MYHRFVSSTFRHRVRLSYFFNNVLCNLLIFTFWSSACKYQNIQNDWIHRRFASSTFRHRDRLLHFFANTHWHLLILIFCFIQLPISNHAKSLDVLQISFINPSSPSSSLTHFHFLIMQLQISNHLKSSNVLQICFINPSSPSSSNMQLILDRRPPQERPTCSQGASKFAPGGPKMTFHGRLLAACLHACLPARLPACLPNCLHAWLPACLLACLPACLPASGEPLEKGRARWRNRTAHLDLSPIRCWGSWWSEPAGLEKVWVFDVPSCKR